MTEPRESLADPLAAFERERRRLFGIAYRMLGSVSEAEDILQDAWLRWHGVEHSEVENPSAYLVRLVTRLCIDTLGAARNRLTDYVGPWLPEPLVGRTQEITWDDPAAIHEKTDDLSLAFLFLLERLSPVERAVFLLRESFDFSHREIAEIVGKSEENCRQIDRRARKRLDEARRPVPTDPREHGRLLGGFLKAVREGDLQSMVDLLAKDAVLYSDGGGKARAAQKPILGADMIARFLLGITRNAPPDWEVRLADVNGATGVVNLVGGKVVSVITFVVEDGRIQGFYIMVNPDKLGRVDV
jgi:RNA polymerase sigma-70 factor (ECF subfamily)